MEREVLVSLTCKYCCGCDEMRWNMVIVMPGTLLTPDSIDAPCQRSPSFTFATDMFHRTFTDGMTRTDIACLLVRMFVRRF